MCIESHPKFDGHCFIVFCLPPRKTVVTVVGQFACRSRERGSVRLQAATRNTKFTSSSTSMIKLNHYTQRMNIAHPLQLLYCHKPRPRCALCHSNNAFRSFLTCLHASSPGQRTGNERELSHDDCGFSKPDVVAPIKSLIDQMHFIARLESPW